MNNLKVFCGKFICSGAAREFYVNSLGEGVKATSIVLVLVVVIIVLIVIVVVVVVTITIIIIISS